MSLLRIVSRVSGRCLARCFVSAEEAAVALDVGRSVLVDAGELVCSSVVRLVEFALMLLLLHYGFYLLLRVVHIRLVLSELRFIDSSLGEAWARSAIVVCGGSSLRRLDD